MDALGIFWIVIYSIIAIISFIKLRTSSSSSSDKTGNQDNSDSRKPYCIGGITERQQGISKCILFLKHTRNKCRNASNDKTGDCDYEDSLNHSKTSIAGRGNGGQPK